MSELSRMSHRAVPVDLVVVPTADATSPEETGLDELGDDALRGALRDPDVFSDVTQAYPGVLGDPEQDPRVVRDERPAVLEGAT